MRPGPGKEAVKKKALMILKQKKQYVYYLSLNMI